MPLTRERLDQRDHREDLAHARGHLPFLTTLRLHGKLGLPIQVQQAVAQQRQRAQGDETDLPVHCQHHGQHPGHCE